jgi:hypothetical protein
MTPTPAEQDFGRQTRDLSAIEKAQKPRNRSLIVNGFAAKQGLRGAGLAQR